MSLLLLFNASKASVRHTIVGSVTTALTPGATLHFTRHASLVGSVTVHLAPSATLHFTRHASIAGSVTTTLTPSATLKYTTKPHIVGSVTVRLTPSATMQATIAPVASTGGVMLRRGRRGTRRALATTTTLQVTPSARMVFTKATPRAVPKHHGIVGAVNVTLSPSGVTVWTQGISESVERSEGDAFVVAGSAEEATVHTAKASSDLTAPPISDADVVDALIESLGQSRAPSIVGSVSIPVRPSGVMAWTAGPAYRPPAPWSPERPAVEQQQDHADIAVIAALYYGMLG